MEEGETSSITLIRYDKIIQRDVGAGSGVVVALAKGNLELFAALEIFTVQPSEVSRNPTFLFSYCTKLQSQHDEQHIDHCHQIFVHLIQICQPAINPMPSISCPR